MPEIDDRGLKFQIVQLRDLGYDFAASIFGWVGLIACRAKEAYACKKWEYYTRSLEKIALTGRAQWLREPEGWGIFLAKDLDMKTCVVSLLDYLRVRVAIPVVEQDHPGLDRLAFFAQNGFPLTEEMIQQAVARKPDECYNHRRRNVEEDKSTHPNEDA